MFPLGRGWRYHLQWPAAPAARSATGAPTSYADRRERIGRTPLPPKARLPRNRGVGTRRLAGTVDSTTPGTGTAPAKSRYVLVRRSWVRHAQSWRHQRNRHGPP